MKSQLLRPEAPSANGIPPLPRSTGSSSYLSKHRRSPSASKAEAASLSPESSQNNNGDSTNDAHCERRKLDLHGSLHRSPPPVSNSLIPAGATISPPDSSHNSSDDEDGARGRQGRTLENLAELQAAIRVIEQRKEGSPNRGDEEIRKARLALDIAVPHLSKELPTSGYNHEPLESPRLPLSKEARKISHSRASTDSSIIFDHEHQAQSPIEFKQDTDEDHAEDSDEGSPSKPPMVRKKSGELVRPALRASSTKRRPSSMPGTPTYSKAVHFDSHLEHVRHFLQVDKPLAVSAGSSPADNYESEIEFPFSSQDEVKPDGPAFEWEVRLNNFCADAGDKTHMPIRLESVFLSSDNKNLIGTAAVHNLAFQKFVVARFTLDYWKTTSEVVADFNTDVRKKQNSDGCDRFLFSIKLEDLANLESKTMFFCVRYNVNGQEHWDNNNGANYQVDFVKKAKPQHARGMPGLGARPLNALPRSKPSPPTSSGNRPKSMPMSFDDFASGFARPFAQSPSSIVGDSPIRLKAPRPRAELVPDAPTRRNQANGQAFGNRYDFGASLSAAIQNASTMLGDQSGLSQKPDAKQSSREVPGSASTVVATLPQPGNKGGARAPTPSITPSAIISEKPALSSQSYQELVDKYCFVGTQSKAKA